MDVFYDGTDTGLDEKPKCPSCDGIGLVFDWGEAGCPEDYCTIACPDCDGTGYMTEDTEEIPY